MISDYLGSVDWSRVGSVALDVVGAVVALFVLLWIVGKCRWYFRQWRWRKSPKVDDNAFFYNLGGGITTGKVKAISEDGTKVRLETSNSSGWYEPKSLRYLTKAEAEYISEIKLAQTIKALRRMR